MYLLEARYKRVEGGREVRVMDKQVFASHGDAASSLSRLDTHGFYKDIEATITLVPSIPAGMWVLEKKDGTKMLMASTKLDDLTRLMKAYCLFEQGDLFSLRLKQQ